MLIAAIRKRGADQFSGSGSPGRSGAGYRCVRPGGPGQVVSAGGLNSGLLPPGAVQPSLAARSLSVTSAGVAVMSSGWGGCQGGAQVGREFS
jgi:hypothetical protein